MAAVFAMTGAVAVSQTISLDGKRVKTLKTINEGVELQQLKSTSSLSKAMPAEIMGVKTNSAAKAPKKAAAAISDIEGEWDCTYTGMLTSNSGNHETTATFEWNDEEEMFEVTIADTGMGLPFLADYDPQTGKFTFELLVLGQNSQGYIATWPMVGTTVQTNGVTATYDADSKSINFDNNSAALGFAVLTAMNTNSLLGYYWAGNNISFSKPEGDYALKIAFEDECTPDNEFKFTVTAGEDIETIYAVAMSGDWEAQELVSIGEQYVMILGQEIEADTYTISPEEEMDESGYYSVMVFGYNAAGALVKKTQDVVFVTLNEDEDYQTIGTVAYNDMLVNGYYNGFSNNNPAVEIQENVNTPGLYRLVDAYAGQSAIHSSDCNHYIYLDVTDPEFVNINTSNTGLDFGDGLLVFGTVGGALGWSKEDCADMGYEVGSINGRTLTFAEGTVYAHEKKYNDPGSWSKMNPNKVMTIELPELVLDVTVVDSSEAKTPVEGVVITVEPVEEETDAPAATAEGEEDANVTGEDGSVSISLPATIDYLASVKVTASYGEEQTATRIVKLNGASNTYSFELDDFIVGDDLTGIAGIETETGAVRYYNLQGAEVKNPQEGSVVIRVEAGKAMKVVK